MIERGKVVAVRKGYATVRIERHSMCGQCGGCAMKPQDPHIDLDLKNVCGAEVGQTVEVVMEGKITLISALAYLVPLSVGIVGLLISYFCKLDEVWQLLCFFVGLAVGYIPLRIYEKKNSKRPQIVSIVSEGDKDGQ